LAVVVERSADDKIPSTTQGALTNVPPQTSRSKRHFADRGHLAPLERSRAEPDLDTVADAGDRLVAAKKMTA